MTADRTAACTQPPCPPPDKPEGRSARKRRQILEAARTLFVENGFSATSVDMVVERAGVSKPTLYSHFGGKAELFAAVVQAQADEFASHSCELAQRPPTEGLRALGVMYLDMVTGQEALQIHRAVFGLKTDGVCREAVVDEAVRLVLAGYAPQPQRE